MANKLEDLSKEQLIEIIKRDYVKDRLNRLNKEFPDNNDKMKIELIEHFIYDCAFDLDVIILGNTSY